MTALATGDTLYYPRQSPARLWHARALLRVPLLGDHSLFAEGSAQRGETSLRLGAFVYF